MPAPDPFAPFLEPLERLGLPNCIAESATAPLDPSGRDRGGNRIHAQEFRGQRDAMGRRGMAPKSLIGDWGKASLALSRKGNTASWFWFLRLGP